MTVSEITTVVESFCEELSTRAPQEVKPFLIGRKDKIKRQDLKQSPERFVSEDLIWPLLNALELDYITEAYLQGQNGQADFLIQNTSEPVLGECKPFNHYKKAVSDLRNYLIHRTTQSAFGIATDGVNWLLIREPGDLRKNPEVVQYHTFRPAMFAYWLSEGVVSPDLEGHYVLWNSTVGEYQDYGDLHTVDPYRSSERFLNVFRLDKLNTQLESSSFDRTLADFSGPPHNESENHSLDDF